MGTSWENLLSPEPTGDIQLIRKRDKTQFSWLRVTDYRGKNDGSFSKINTARMSAQKARLVADQIRGKGVEEALELLPIAQRKAAVLIKKVLNSAIANAEHNEGVDIDELKVSTIYVDEAMTLKAH